MNLRFEKMHGLGNDFVVVPPGQGDPPPPTVIKQLAHRRLGIGFDQLLWLSETDDPGTDIRYRVFNGDGSEVEQCGNGARCIAQLVARDKGLDDGSVRMESPAGIVAAKVHADGRVSVDMGAPILEPSHVPFLAEGPGPHHVLQTSSGPLEVTVLSMGNPHCVIRVADLESAGVAELGPFLEHHEAFPNRANIGFMQVDGPDHIRLRVHERGVGETRACGSGACAAVVTGILSGTLEREVSVDLPGGTLSVRWDSEQSPVWLTGEAIKVFEGIVDT